MAGRRHGMLRDTRLESWIGVQASLGPRQQRVLAVIETFQGAPAFRIAETLNLPLHSVSGRLTELYNLGLIEDHGERYHNHITNRNVIVWFPTRTIGETFNRG